MLHTQQWGKGSFGRDVMLLTVEGEVVVRDIVNLLKVQGIYGSLG